MPGSFVLAHASKYHHIVQNHINEIQLTWGRFHTQLLSEDLAQLARLVERWTPGTPSLSTADGSFCVGLDAQGYVQVWIVDSGLRLRPEGFLILSYLLCTAAHSVGRGAEAANACARCPFEPFSSMIDYVVVLPELLN